MIVRCLRSQIMSVKNWARNMLMRFHLTSMLRFKKQLIRVMAAELHSSVFYPQVQTRRR